MSQYTIYFDRPRDDHGKEQFEEYGSGDVSLRDYGIEVKLHESQESLKIIPWHRVHRVEVH